MVWDKGTAQIVEGIYDAVDTEQGWMPLLGILAEQFGAKGTHLFVRDLASNEAVEDSYYGADIVGLKAEFQRLLPTDPVWPISLQNVGAIINDVDYYGDALFEKTPIYNEVLTQVDCRYRAATVQPISAQLVAGLAVTRPKPMGSFGKEHIEHLQVLLPHLVRALRLQQRLRSLERDADNIAAALDGLPTAAVIVSETLKITCVNSQADKLLATCKSLRVRHNQLAPEGCEEASALRQAVGEAIALADSRLAAPIAPPQVVTIRRPGKLPLDLLAVPLRPRYQLRQNIGQNARVLIMIYDPESRPRIDEQLLERLFDLTGTEAFIAARLAEGMSVAEVAQARRCSPATVRTHVKHIFQKTHTNRQGELVQLLLTSPAISFAG